MDRAPQGKPPDHDGAPLHGLSGMKCSAMSLSGVLDVACTVTRKALLIWSCCSVDSHLQAFFFLGQKGHPLEAGHSRLSEDWTFVALASNSLHTPAPGLSNLRHHQFSSSRLGNIWILTGSVHQRSMAITALIIGMPPGVPEMLLFASGTPAAAAAAAAAYGCNVQMHPFLTVFC